MLMPGSHTVRATCSRAMREVERAADGPREGVGGLGDNTLEKQKKEERGCGG